MPKINRIRIINFAYNDDVREITDEIFRFYDGENALLNLANGGGKSVLVQLMMQPILPDLKMQKRKMLDYFKKGTSPAYVILEWLLDHHTRKEYLMTGIAIAPKSSAYKEDTGHIHYFTFGSHYLQAAPFDLANLPFVKKEDGRAILMPFEKARESVRKITSARREAFYYSREDASEYRKKLLEFGISQEEWKNIIVRMNNDEGGITELFERCNTSDSIFDEWIIKNIEKVHLAGEENQTEIRELLQRLADETIKKEDYIRARELMERYGERHGQMEDRLEELKQELLKEQKANQLFLGMHAALEQMEGQLMKEQEEVRESVQQQKRIQNHITQEEVSEAFYRKRELLEQTEREAAALEELWEKAQERCKENSYAKECQKGARIWTKIQSLSGAADALRLQIEDSKQGNDTAQRIQNLAYSLRIIWEQKFREEEAKEKALDAERENLQKNQEAYREERSSLEERSGQIHQKIGYLDGKIWGFEQQDAKLQQQLGISLLRNVLKEIQPEAAAEAKETMDQEVSQAQKRYERLKQEKEQSEKEQERLAESQIALEKRKMELVRDREDLEKAQERFFREKQSCLDIFHMYDIDPELLYEAETLQKMMDEKINEQSERIAGEQMEEKNIRDLLYGLKNHSVYLPETLLACLDGADVAYETGESYLQNLSEDERQKMLKKQPMLPFGIILSEKELHKAGQVSYKNCYVRQIVPFFVYDRLGEADIDEGMIVSGGDSKILAVYEEQIFGDEKRQSYVKKMKNQLRECRKRKTHWEEERSCLFQRKTMLKSFDYKREFEEETVNRISGLSRELTNLEGQKEEEKNQQNILRDRMVQMQSKLPEMEQAWREAKERRLGLEDYLEEDRLYRKNRKESAEVSEQLEDLEVRLSELKKLEEEDQNSLEILHQKLLGARNTKDDAKKQLAGYDFAQEGEFIEISRQQLEQEYETLRSEQSAGENDLRRRLEEKELQIQEAMQELEELSISKEECQETDYEKDEFLRLKEEGIRLKEEADKLQKDMQDLRIKEAGMKSDVENARQRLMDTGIETPVSKEEIRQDYQRRRRQCEEILKGLDQKQKELIKQQGDCREFAGRIEDLTTTSETAAAPIELEEDLERQFIRLRKNCRNAKDAAQAKKRECQSFYGEMRGTFYGKNPCISDILDTLLHLSMEASDLKEELVRYYLEEYGKKKESLQKLLDFYGVQLENIQHTKQQVADQCMNYAGMLYEEVKSIAQKSRVHLTGKSRPVQMLRIDVPKELDGEERVRMENYLDSCLDIMIRLHQESDAADEKKMKERLAALTSGRELLNQLIGTNKIPVYVYKIDLNEKNSGLKRWEDAMSQNSGGEKFVVFFTMVATLITYIRTVTRRNAGEDPMEETKVLIMDNPFARTSSEHLLRAVIDIADTFSIQLICLSDLSQSSITNRFSLIYQLSIRRRMYSDKEVLKIGDVKLNKPGISENEKLEHMELYETTKQEELWDWMERL